MTASVLDTLAPSAAPRKKNDPFAIQASGKADYKAKSLDDSDARKSFANHMKETQRPSAESSGTPTRSKTAASKPSSSNDSPLQDKDGQTDTDESAIIGTAPPLATPPDASVTVIPAALDLTGPSAPQGIQTEGAPQALAPASSPEGLDTSIPKIPDNAAFSPEGSGKNVLATPEIQVLQPLLADAAEVAGDAGIDTQTASLIKKAIATASTLADAQATDSSGMNDILPSSISTATKTVQAGAIPLAQEGVADDATALDKTATLESVKAPARDDAVTPALNALEAKKNNPVFSKPDSEATVSNLGDTRSKEASPVSPASNPDSGKAADQQTPPTKFVQMLGEKTESTGQSATASSETSAEKTITTTSATQDSPDTQQPVHTTPAHTAPAVARTYPPHILAQAPAAIVQLGVDIAAQHRKGTSKFDIRLDPAELGSVDVRIEIDRYGRVKSHLIVEKAETLELLKADLRGLERALEQAGLRADPGALSLNLRDPSQSNPFRDSEGSAFRQTPADDDSADTETAHVQIAYQSNNGSASGLDIRV